MDISQLTNSLVTTQPQASTLGMRKSSYDVAAALAAQILQTRFPELLTGAGTMKQVAEIPGRKDNAVGVTYTRDVPADGARKGDVMLKRPERSAMHEQKIDGQWVGMENVGNVTTDDVLNMVETALHELTHNRTVASGQPPSILTTLATLPALYRSGLPSTNTLNPNTLLQEFVASAVPAQQMQRLGPGTAETQQTANTVNRLLTAYPQLQTLIQQNIGAKK